MQLPAFAAPALIVSCLLLSACNNGPVPQQRDATDAVLFGPASMRLHPIFTTVKNWTGTPRPDGIEALVELQDQFGDPTKASGKVIFHLYEFKKFDPERRGPQLAEWVGDLSSLEAQRDRWNRTSRTYTFQLAYGQVDITHNYMLTAEFQLGNGSRLFNTLVIQQQITPSKYNVPDYGMPPTQPSQGMTPTTTPMLTPLAPNEPGMRTPEP